jgi:hypothetical protein
MDLGSVTILPTSTLCEQTRAELTSNNTVTVIIIINFLSLKMCHNCKQNYKSLNVYNKRNISLEDILTYAQSYWLTSLSCALSSD